jgi:hypothetical protein
MKLQVTYKHRFRTSQKLQNSLEGLILFHGITHTSIGTYDITVETIKLVPNNTGKVCVT